MDRCFCGARDCIVPVEVAMPTGDGGGGVDGGC